MIVRLSVCTDEVLIIDISGNILFTSGIPVDIAAARVVLKGDGHGYFRAMWMKGSVQLKQQVRGYEF